MIGPVVEGHGEERIVPIVLKWLGVKHRPPLRAGGKPDLKERALDYAEQHFERGATHILFFFDADGPDGDAQREGLRARFPTVAEKLFFFVPIYELEAWLLADEKALSTVLDTPVEPVKSPEDIVEPVERISSIFRAAGRAYRKALDAPKIARFARDERWIQRCPSYEQATRSLRAE